MFCLYFKVFHCHFNSNFFPLFLDALVGDTIAPGIGPFLIGNHSCITLIGPKNEPKTTFSVQESPLYFHISTTFTFLVSVKNMGCMW